MRAAELLYKSSAHSAKRRKWSEHTPLSIHVYNTLRYIGEAQRERSFARSCIRSSDGTEPLPLTLYTHSDFGCLLQHRKQHLTSRKIAKAYCCTAHNQHKKAAYQRRIFRCAMYNIHIIYKLADDRASFLSRAAQYSAARLSCSRSATSTTRAVLVSAAKVTRAPAAPPRALTRVSSPFRIIYLLRRRGGHQPVYNFICSSLCVFDSGISLTFRDDFLFFSFLIYEF